MREVFNILLGGGFTVACCWAMGRLLLHRLGVRLHRFEQDLIAFAAGSACLSLFTFLLCAIQQARKGVFQWSGLGCIILAVWLVRREPKAGTLPRPPRMWMVLFLFIFTIFFVVYFFNALAPESSADGSGYHLGNVNRWLHYRGFAWNHHNMYSYLSQGMEMLYLVAFAFGRHSGASMVHLAFLLALPWLLICFGLRHGHPRAGIFAAIVVYASPVVGLDGSIAYNDVALSFITLAIVYCLEVWVETKDIKLIYLIGILCGYSYSIKYTAATVVLLSAGWVLWHCRRARIDPVRPLVWLFLPAGIVAGPWVLRNWIWLGNPAAPFLNRWFPNPYYHAGMEQIYTEGLRQYQDLAHWWQLPWELTMRGGAGVTGFLGAVFLLSPLALLALRHALGRRLLLSAAVLALPALLNTGTRFLIPPLPLVALAMGLALENSRGTLPALAVFQAVLSWPTVMPAYAHPYSWRIGSIPVEAALRQIRPDEFLARRIGNFPLINRLDSLVPPSGRIFAFAGQAEAYTHREILVSYESAEANLVNDILLAPIDGYKPTRRMSFRFPPQPLAAVRVVQTASAQPFWGVAELRLLSGDRELARDSAWRISARPNGWEAPLAFDNSPVTRWLSWEAIRPGQFLEVRFPGPLTLDQVRLECASVRESRLRLEGQGSGGGWRELTAGPELSDTDPPPGMRRSAALEVKARGIEWLLVGDGDFAWQDMGKYPFFWGLTEAGESGGTHLLHID